MSLSPSSTQLNQSIISYTTPWTIYGMDWCNYDHSKQQQRLLISSFKQDYSNCVQIVNFNQESGIIEKLHEVNTMYPPTKVMWIPNPQSFHCDVFAFSGDYLRIYRLDNETSSPIVDAILNKDNSPDRCSPVSSFDWNRFTCNIIGATTLDSICTIWDIETQQPISKVRSHSSEVYDISFSTTNSNTFLTCGEDGSLRIFDLRSINQFSVLYKTMNQPILRASWNEQNNSTIGFIQKDDQDVYLIDIRNPSSSLPLHSHSAPVNAFAWSPISSQYIVSVGEDSHCFIWDFEKLSSEKEFEPSFVYNASSPIHNVKWSKQLTSWISLCYDNHLELCHT